MYIIIGINHPRIVGIWKKTGEVENFDPVNLAGYRPAENATEEAEELTAAKAYYDICVPSVKTGDFGVLKITPEQVEKLAEHPELYRVIVNTIQPSNTSIVMRRCRYCGELFIPSAPAQRVCKKKECQTKRRTDVMRNYRKNKKEEE